MNDWLELRIHIRGQTYTAHVSLPDVIRASYGQMSTASACQSAVTDAAMDLTMQLCWIAARDDPFVCSLTRLWPDTHHGQHIDEEPW